MYLRTLSLLGAALFGLQPVQAQSLFLTAGEVLATNGGAVPGMPVGTVYGGTSTFDLPSLDLNGSVIFRARMQGPTITPTTERALFRGQNSGNLSILIQAGSAAPSLPGLTLNTATASGIGSSARLSQNGLTFWGSSLSGSGVTTSDDTALFGGPDMALDLIVREGSPAPGTLGATFSSSFSAPSTQNTGINENGRVLFKSNLAGGDVSGSTNNEAWYSGVIGALELVARKGDVVPVTGGDAVLGALSFLSQMNSVNQVLYDGSLSTTLGTAPATTSDDKVVFVWTPGVGSALLLREGEPAPGTVGAVMAATSTTWSPGTGSNTFNASGEFFFATELFLGDVVGTSNNRALYIASAAGKTLVLRKGDAATDTDATWGVSNNSFMGMNNDGRIVFASSIEGGTSTAADDSGIWTGVPGNLQLIAREGALAPDTAGATFGGFGGLSVFINGQGQVFFQTDLLGGDVTGPSNDNALYGWDPSLGLRLVLRGGDPIEALPGDVRTVSTWGGFQFNNGSSNPLSYSQNGTVALRVNFSGGTAAIVKVQLPTNPGTAFCFGDGSGIACPCGNNGGAGRGCDNGTGSTGALLGNTGTASVLAADLTLLGSGAQPNQPGLFFQGDNAINGGNGILFGDGLRCAGGGVRRIEIRQADAGGASATTVNISAVGLVSPGQTKRYQWWYRNPGASPCGTGFNLSNGIELTWVP